VTAHDPFETLPDVPSFSVASTSFNDGQELQANQRSAAFGVPGGRDLSPQLSWSGAPAETKSYTVTVFDPDAPDSGGFWHWAVVNLPADVTSLEEGAGARDGSRIPSPALQLKNDGGFRGFIGAGPPKGHGKHRYIVTVLAVEVEELGVDAGTAPAALVSHLAGHTLARASITGLFGR
jgi:Raf kinase inhibitor-like YbhB/YbcL family protein